MRKALIAVIAAAVLFAVGAFAASLTVESENVASGDDNIEACATAVDVESWLTTAPSGTADTADYEVTQATVALTEAAAGACTGADVELAVRSDGTGSDTPGWTNHTCASNDDGGTAAIEFDCAISPSLEVGPIVQVGVLVNGDTYETPTP